MSNIATHTGTNQLTAEQIVLIKNTVAKGATNDELSLFLHRASSLGLDPLKPGQIYFIKYGNSPGTIVVGLDGFRSRAARTGKHSGTARGILRSQDGKCLGAWCEVSRSDWNHPARVEVSLSEYDTGKGTWIKLKETMIQKVAECSALRMAFPDDLGGVYAPEEMEQADAAINSTVRVPIEGSVGKTLYVGPVDMTSIQPLENPGEYAVAFGKKYKGQLIRDIDMFELENFISWCKEQANAKGLPMSHEAEELSVNFEAYIARRSEEIKLDGEISFEDVNDDEFDQPPTKGK